MSRYGTRSRCLFAVTSGGFVILLFDAGARTPPPRDAVRICRQTTGLGQRLPEQELYVGIRAPQFVPSPARQRIVNLWIQSEEEFLPLSHAVLSIPISDRVSRR